ncbi:DNA-3-methyladenine glycosylase [Paenibacillus agilis]|uniref:DNA-3-methyladenine glycosylase n=1 Tax=Paenibacillus agilis TaxID=3020863 RepID=UPI0021BDBE2A|nr:DNA-3-methyladenine glycosylase [Paenibacillus agilis]
MDLHRHPNGESGRSDRELKQGNEPSQARLPLSWFRQGALPLAPQLLGRTIVRVTDEGVIRARIVETESYVAPHDKGCHAYNNRRTKRTETMFQRAGHAYVYLIYGMYHCLNVVAAEEGQAEAVLIRAVAPLTECDESIMKRYRSLSSNKFVNLSNGPGKLCRAMHIDKSFDGYDMIAGEEMWLEAGKPVMPEHILCATRINIPYAEEYADVLWRFYVADDPYVSVKDKQAVSLAVRERMLETFGSEDFGWN